MGTGQASLAQFNCPNPEWRPGSGLVDTNWYAFATHWWDPDGTGPAEGMAVFGGIFTRAGEVAAGGIAAYHPASKSWSSMLGGVKPAPGKKAWINALATLPDGRLMVGGSFSQIGTTLAKSVAAWDGTIWTGLGFGLPGGEVYAITTLSSGEPVVNDENQVFRLNGSTWVPLSVAMSGPVYALAAASNDDVYVGGQFAWAGGVPASNIGRWNGSAWTSLGSGVTGTNAAVSAIAVLPSSDVIAAGVFSGAGGVSALNIARWNGSEWSSIGDIDATPSALTILPSGELLASGPFMSAGGTGVLGVALWDGTAWSQFGKPFQTDAPYKKTGLTLAPGGDLYISAHLTDSSGVWATHWNGTDFVPLSNGNYERFAKLKTTPSGDVLGVGTIRFLDGQPIVGVARWNGRKWNPVGSLAGSFSQGFVDFGVDEMTNGDIVAVGGFKLTNGTSTKAIRFDGQAWSSLVTSFNGDLYAVRALQSNGVVVGGKFSGIDGVPANGVAIWDPSKGWMATGAGISEYVKAVEELPTGDIVAAGQFGMAGGKWMTNVGRWDGTAWWPIGGLAGSGGASSVETLSVLPNGTLVAGGFIQDYIAAWNGTNWTPLGGGLPHPIYTIVPLADGDLLASGFSLSETTAIHRFDGVTWTPMATVNGSGVEAVAVASDQTVLVSGFFSTVGSGIVSEGNAVFGCPPAPPCYPDCDQSGSLDIDDFLCFQTLYALGEPAADCDASGGLDIDDFICFQTSYAIGC